MECQDCKSTFDHKFAPTTHGEDIVSGGHCPNCGSYRTQPSPVRDEMTHGLDALPSSTQDDGSGNPLKEGILADGGWQNRNKRDESYASVKDDWAFDRMAPHDETPGEAPRDVTSSHRVACPPLLAIPEVAALAAGAGEGAAAAGGLAAAGEAGAAAEGAGGVGGLLGRAAPTLKKMYWGDKVGNLMGQALSPNGYPPQQQDQGPAEVAQTNQMLGHFLYADESDLSNPGFYDTDDPERVDQQEHNYGDDKPYEHDSGEKGSDPFSAETMSSFHDLLPLILHYSGQDKSGHDHPDIDNLHKKLEQEIPDYLENPATNNPQAVTDCANKIEAELSKHRHAAPNPGHVPNPTQQFQTPLAAPHDNPHNKCPNCGSTYDPSSPNCPQCGMPVPNNMTQPAPQAPGVPQAPGMAGMVQHAALGDSQHHFQYEQSTIPPGMTMQEYKKQRPPAQAPDWQACPLCDKASDANKAYCPHCDYSFHGHPDRLSAATQGPHTPEQIAAVQQVLIDSGRTDEVPNVPIQPWMYARELAQIQATEPPPEGPEPGEAPAAPPPPPPSPDGAPDPSGGMPMPGMQAPPMGMQSALKRHVADSIACKCPKCDSHTTSMLTNGGVCRCSNCGHTWNDKNILNKDKESRWKVAGPHHPQRDGNPIGVPAADQEVPYDPEADQGGGTWSDENGAPLKVGQEYKIYSPQFSIPDIVRVTEVKPESIEVQEIGAYGLGYSREIPHEEFKMNAYSFEPTNDPPEKDHPEKDAVYPEPSAGDQTDLSMASPTASLRTAGAKMTPMEQRSYIDEQGTARNFDKLDLAGTHYDTAEEENDHFLWL